MSEDVEKMLREFDSASSAVRKQVGGKGGEGTEAKYGQAYQALVKAGAPMGEQLIIIAGALFDAMEAFQKAHPQAAALGLVFIGLLAGTISYWACSVLKPKFGYDDALDTFGVHGIGGTIGALATALLMDGAVNEAGGKLVAKGLLMGQLTAMLLCIVVSLVMTWIIAKLVAVTIGLRPSEEAEAQGLDIADHGEEGYNAN